MKKQRPSQGWTAIAQVWKEPTTAAPGNYEKHEKDKTKPIRRKRLKRNSISSSKAPSRGPSTARRPVFFPAWRPTPPTRPPRPPEKVGQTWRRPSFYVVCV